MEKHELLLTAQQAMLELSEQELAELSGEIQVMLEHMAVMDEVDADDLEPTTHALSPEDAVMRRDQPESDMQRRSFLLKQAPELDGTAVKLPKVML